MDYLGLKDSSRDFQPNCVTSLFFLSTFNVPYICQRFDGIDENFLSSELNRASSIHAHVNREHRPEEGVKA